MARRPAARSRGFTTWELVVTLALVAILALVAVPAFGRLRADLGTTAIAEQLVASLQLARTSAIARATPVSVCPSADGATCTAHAGDPTSGWIVFVGSRSEDAADDTAPAPLRAVRLAEGYRIATSRSAIAYWPDTRAGTTATIVVCRHAEPGVARSVVVSQTGRPRVAQADAALGATCAD